MTKACATCGADFNPRSHRGTYCSDKCRARAGYLRKNGVSLPALRLAPPAADAATDGSLTAVTQRDLDAWGLAHTVGATLALLLARAIDSGSFTGSGLTALTREYRVVWHEIEASSKPEVERPLDRIRRVRDERRGGV
jgi:hypothetical protein